MTKPRVPFSILAGACLLAPAVLLPAMAHCPGSPPVVKFTYPSVGTAIQEACYSDFGACFLDTFQVAKLRDTVASLYKAGKYAIFGYVDSVRNYETYDTTYYMGQVYYIDTFTTEKVDVSVHTFLKDSLPVRRLSFIDRWIAFLGNPLATTYIPLKDTPFVAFFDRYDSLKYLGLGPMDGCFFEPTVFAIHPDGIHRKGLPGERMPGIHLTMEEFFQAVGHDPVPVPPVGIIRRVPLRSRSIAIESGYRFDANGRRLGAGSRKGRGWVFSTWGMPVLEPPGTVDGVSRPR